MPTLRSVGETTHPGLSLGAASASFFDMGLTQELRLANLPVDRMTEPHPAYGAYVTAFKEALQKQGVSGASLAVMKNGQTLVSAGFGFRDKHLTAFMPRDAVMRLASNDKVITQAAIVKLISEGWITPSTPVFPLLNLDPVPGYAPGANVNSITVEHLRTHRSGIGDTSHSQEAVDEMAFKFGITSAQWNRHHNARCFTACLRPTWAVQRAIPATATSCCVTWQSI